MIRKKLAAVLSNSASRHNKYQVLVLTSLALEFHVGCRSLLYVPGKSSPSSKDGLIASIWDISYCTWKNEKMVNSKFMVKTYASYKRSDFACDEQMIESWWH